MKDWKWVLIGLALFAGGCIGTAYAQRADGDLIAFLKAGIATHVTDTEPLAVDGPQIDIPRTNQTACAATATPLESLVCIDSLIINRLSTSTESCFVGGASVAVADGFELTGSNGFDQRVTNSNIFSCISATNNCSVTYLCGDAS